MIPTTFEVHAHLDSKVFFFFANDELVRVATTARDQWIVEERLVMERQVTDGLCTVHQMELHITTMKEPVCHLGKCRQKCEVRLCREQTI